ncbi:tRNA lysidine(34) synthetase TilS [Paenibacillus sp. ACRRX]|uniref:tRNA lysidine(34) synthetase TilS n=1 Tax=Paenibacillus sp. ACRRX TaxID=2918206 RepID=UPI001EF416F4|nr:tRNA lysidine(34) synthetase TilS [Paenibacillus sp. ACRRX]MCG7410758.1 tRNA lysidine(34) synthetase TilS [Paenibacillus sp. ACRRX]
MSAREDVDHYDWQRWIQDRHEQAIKRKLWHVGDRVVVAVSGGPDSMLLMHMLAQMEISVSNERLHLVIAHVHHGFRQEESDEEALLVAEQAALLGLPFEMTRVDAPGHAQRYGMNAQAAARELRYAFLREVAVKHKAALVALAHHADDQAETVLMRFLRGTGTAGLSGMVWKRSEAGINYIRPLLDMRKHDIVQRCASRGIIYANDSSNSKRSYLRNRLRLDVLPMLEQENPRLVESLGQMAEMMQGDHDWLESETRLFFESHVKAWNDGNNMDIDPCISKLTRDDELISYYAATYRGGCLLDRNLFLKVHVALQRRLIKLILNYLLREAEQVNYDAVERLRLMAIQEDPTTLKADVGGGVHFHREYNRLIWLLDPETVHPDLSESRQRKLWIERTATEGILQLPTHTGTITWTIASHKTDSNHTYSLKNSSEAAFDADKLQWPIKIRTRMPGDRMRVQGLNGSKKVQDMFVDMKVPPTLRDSLPVITDGQENIIWIPGVRRSDMALVQPATRSILHIGFASSLRK